MSWLPLHRSGRPDDKLECNWLLAVATGAVGVTCRHEEIIQVISTVTADSLVRACAAEDLVRAVLVHAAQAGLRIRSVSGVPKWLRQSFELVPGSVREAKDPVTH